MGIETAIIGAGAKLVGGAIAGKAAGNAAQQKAAAVERSAKNQRTAFKQNKNAMTGQFNNMSQDAMALAEADPKELADLENAYANTEKQLAREERFVNAIDPALMEASQQALKLLRGEEADINKPMQTLRNKQREGLVASLRSQYGNGAELSSVGRQALQDFDMQTSTLAAQNQQSALGQAFGIATSDVMGGLRQTGGALTGIAGSLSQGRMGQRNRMLETRLGLGNTGLNMGQNFMNQQLQMEAGIGKARSGVAGADQVGKSMFGNMISGLGGQILGAGLAGENPFNLSSIFGGGGGGGSYNPGVIGDQNVLADVSMRGGGAGYML